ncbi:MAG: hypothetical protein JSS51_10750 [Planctomycetes bacterium]|nr:hypothetical protein [Planctomycetota bacterium]
MARTPRIRIARITQDWRPRAGRLREFVSVQTLPTPKLALLKSENDSFVARAVLEGVPVVVKWRALVSLADRTKALMGASRAFRQWRGARRLARGGIPAARPLALLLQAGASHPGEWLVLEEAPGETVLHALATDRLSPRDQHALARAVGVQVGAMLRAGLCNRDHKPSNLIVEFEGVDGARVPILTLIDTVAIRRRSNPGEMVRMLATLLIETIGVGVAPRGAIAFRVLRDACAAWLEGTLGRPLGSHPGDRKALRALVRSTARRVDQYIQTHGDPTPKVDPLKRPVS